MTRKQLRRLSNDQLELLMDDERLSLDQFQMVREVIEHRENRDYMNQAMWGADGSDPEMARKFDSYDELSFETRFDLGEVE